MKVRERSLGKVSVVQIARAVVSHASCVEARVECAVGMRSRILEIGRLVGGFLVMGISWGWAMHLIEDSSWVNLPLSNDAGAHH